MALKIDDAEWCDEAAEMLKLASPGTEIENIRHQVESEGAVLFKVSDDGATVGYYVLRVDALATHREGVLVAATGFSGQYDLTKTILPMIERQLINCKKIRIHTARPGLIRKLSNSGYVPVEFVMTKGI